MSVTTADSSLERAPVSEEHAAIVRRRSDNSWVWQVTALSIVLGVLLALAIRTTERIRKAGFPGTRLGVSTAILSRFRDQNEGLQAEIKDLRAKMTEYEENLANGSRSTELLNKELQELKALTGLSAVEGPGLRITLRDSLEKRLPNLPPEEYQSYNVHDQDINGLLNELRAAGGEAFAISGADPNNLQRVIVTTAARCVGPTAVVNGTQLSAPYTILAIGNPKELKAALEMPEGFIQSRGLDVLKMITIEEEQKLVLPAYSGSFRAQHARPAPKSP